MPSTIPLALQRAAKCRGCGWHMVINEEEQPECVNPVCGDPGPPLLRGMVRRRLRQLYS